MNNNDGMAHQHGGQHLDGAVGSFGSQGQQHQQLLMPQDGVQGGSQQSQGASQQDILTQQLHQVLIADTGRFWTTTVAPSTQAIAQVCVSDKLVVFDAVSVLLSLLLWASTGLLEHGPVTSLGACGGCHTRPQRASAT